MKQLKLCAAKRFAPSQPKVAVAWTLCVDSTCDAALPHSAGLFKFVGFSADHVAGVNVTWFFQIG